MNINIFEKFGIAVSVFLIITTVMCARNYNFPADSWYDDLKISTINAERIVKNAGLKPTMYVKPEEVTDELEIKLIIDNLGDYRLNYGKMYRFEKYENGSWVEVPSEWVWTLPLSTLLPGESAEDSLNIKGLDSGMYRVVKDFEVDETKKKITLDTEFNVDRPEEPDDEIPRYGYRYSWGLAIESKESPNRPMLELHNLGARTLYFDSAYILEHKQNCAWVKIYENKPQNITSVARGENYKLKIGEADMPTGDYRLSLTFGIEGTSARETLKITFDR